MESDAQGISIPTLEQGLSEVIPSPEGDRFEPSINLKTAVEPRGDLQKPG